MRIIIASDDWSLGGFAVFNSIPVISSPDKNYDKYVEEIRERFKESWVKEVAEKLGLGEVARAHLFCVKKTPDDADEEAMNIIVF
jgi:hypothetical protein